MKPSEVKKVYIKSYGCQMNVYDSERMMEILAILGFKSTSAPHEAHLIILNTCQVREKATEKVYSDLGRIKEIKEARSDGVSLIIAVAGCTAQAEGAEIMKRAPYVDMVFGPQTYHQLPQMLAELIRKRDSYNGARPGQGILNTEFPEEVKFDFLPERSSPQGVSAFLSVQEGCDKFCNFCVVPYTRGAEYSRPGPKILQEAQQLVDRGVHEITLLGQNVNAYHGTGESEKIIWSLGKLIRELAKIEGLQRIRYTTSHPNDVDEDLILAHRDVEKLMPYLHLPVQSGSDKILKAMNRKHTVSDYLRIIMTLKEVRSDIVYSSDFIVGYPGETEEDFEATIDLIQTVKFAQAYSFKYSQRPGTPAATLPHQIEEEVKIERLERLQSLLRDQQTAFNQSLIGKTLPVLWEKSGRHQGQLIGRSPYLQSVHTHLDPSFIGTLSNVEIVSASMNSLTGISLSTNNSFLKRSLNHEGFLCA